jgi:hypothetical protein
LSTVHTEVAPGIADSPIVYDIIGKTDCNSVLKEDMMGTIGRVLVCLIALAAGAYAQQVADSSFNPPIANPAYPTGKGPVVMIDEGHNNFHTAGGRYYPFARLLQRDGYRILPSGCSFTADSLARGNILVISNALNERNIEDWSLPTPSAFTDDEISTIVRWVSDGGALFLIADHMPLAGCAEKLAAAFGFAFNNGFAMQSDTTARGPYRFRRANGTLADHVITRGRDSSERIDSVVSFTGQAFRADSALGLMIFGDSVVSLVPQVAWEFSDSTPTIDVKGWYQGAVRTFGKGRVAVFGEAAMFSAQLAGPERRPAGMNHPIAAENPQFLLNVMHWLSGIIP